MSLYPEIQIDHTKCTVPFDCKKCLQVCPQVVFAVHVIKVERFKETEKKDPGAYQLDAPYRDKCIMCNDCIKVCPVEALKITL